MKGNHLVEVNRWTQAISRNIEHYKRDANPQTASSSDGDSRSMKSLSASLKIGKYSFSSRRLTDSPADSVSISSFNEVVEDQRDVPIGQVAVESEMDEEEQMVEDDTSDARSERGPPHEASFALHGNSTAAQVDLTAQLLQSLALPQDASQQLRDLRSALVESATVAQNMIGEYVRMVSYDTLPLIQLHVYCSTDM